MLTTTILKANEALNGLSDDQLNVIATLSANDENSVIGERIGQLHGQYDNDVLSVAGINKNQGEKSYDYVKRVIKDFKEKSSALEQEVNKLKIAAPEESQKVKDALDKFNALQSQYHNEKSDWEKKYNDSINGLNEYKLGVEFNMATSAFKFKPEFTDSIKDALVNVAKSNVLKSYIPSWETVNDSEVLVFRQSNGEIARNPENKLEPYTAKDLLKLQLKDAIDTTNKVGGGTTPPKVENDGLISISNAKSQIEADEIIVKHLLEEGYTRLSADFAAKQKDLRLKYGVDKLKLR